MGLQCMSLHGNMRARRDQLAEDVRSLSFSVGGAGAWLEKLKVVTHAPEREAALGDDALVEIERALAELLGGDAAEALSEHVAELSRKLPLEVLELVPELKAASPELLAELRGDVQSLLRQRLALGQETP